MPVCAWVDGEYGLSGAYLGVEAEIGREGIRKVVETPLTDDEKALPRRGLRGSEGQAGRRQGPLTPPPFVPDSGTNRRRTPPQAPERVFLPDSGRNEKETHT